MAGTVYVLTSDYCKLKSLYKIGYTTNKLADRISTLNTGCGSAELKLYCVSYHWQVPDCRQREKKLHSEFAHRRQEREFFKLSRNDLNKLVEMMDGQSNPSESSSDSSDDLPRCTVKRKGERTYLIFNEKNENSMTELFLTAGNPSRVPSYSTTRAQFDPDDLIS